MCEQFDKLCESIISQARDIEHAEQLAKDDPIFADGFFGIESVACGERESRYLNTGDTYSTTIMEEDGALFVSSYGDWLEGCEREQYETEGERRCGNCGKFTPYDDEDFDETVCEHCGNYCNRSEAPPAPKLPELDVTALVNRSDEMIYYSASRAELGDDAGAVTWQNSLDNVASDNPDGDGALISHPQDISAARDYFADFGAWEREEIDGWSKQEVNALLLQDIAGAIREYFRALDDAGGDENSAEFQQWQANCGGRLYRCDDGQWWFYVGM